MASYFVVTLTYIIPMFLLLPIYCWSLSLVWALIPRKTQGSVYRLPHIHQILLKAVYVGLELKEKSVYSQQTDSQAQATGSPTEPEAQATGSPTEPEAQATVASFPGRKNKRPGTHCTRFNAHARSINYSNRYTETYAE